MNILLRLFIVLGALTLHADFGEPEQIVVNNRILATVNGKTISVMDVKKKMDVFLNEYYPEASQSKAACYQFYSTNWKEQLSQMIDNELMLADAEEREVKVTDGEVRETLQQRFGPNVMGTLDHLGLTYDEARKLIHDEMVVQRMTWLRIHSKALHAVGVKDVKKAYQEFLAHHAGTEEWKYRVLSIRSGEGTSGEAAAEKAYTLLQNKKTTFEQVVDQLKSEYPGLTCQVSPEYQVTDKSISNSHKTILAALAPRTYSKPTVQTSRLDKTTLTRIFSLIDHTKAEAPPFNSVSAQIKDDLLGQAAAKEKVTYRAKLRQRFGNDEKSVPDNFQPFAVK